MKRCIRFPIKAFGNDKVFGYSLLREVRSMGGFRGLLLSVLLLWICLISACRTTERQLYYSPVSVPTGLPYTALTPEAEGVYAAQTQPIGSKIPFLLVTIAILTIIILVFASDGKPKKKRSSSPKKRSKKINNPTQ
jgi:hypothetical protein